MLVDPSPLLGETSLTQPARIIIELPGLPEAVGSSDAILADDEIGALSLA
jgi:hypothetical protein